MTRETLYDKMHKALRPITRNTELATDLLDEFFESNICIPKRQSLHTYADVIHAYAEGINNIEVLRSEGWVEFKQSGMCLCIGDEYRIKPSEPVWEYQFSGTPIYSQETYNRFMGYKKD